jgi:hypothetical protein
MSEFNDEPAKSAIDKDWPYQVAFPAALCQGTAGLVMHDFCKDLKMCEVHYAFRRHGTEYWVYCFADRAEAEKFRRRFNGEFIDARGV